MNMLDRDAPPKLELMVFATSDDALVYHLPPTGKVILGRGDDVDIRIDDPSVSRRHATLHLDAPMRIEDLGSSNGTYVRRREERINAADTRKVHRKPGETFVVDIGECIVLGSIMATIRRLPSARRGSDPAPPAPSSDRVVVQAPAMQALYDHARRMARSDMSVLILGETGVGKEVLARAIHKASPRSKGPFLAIHCAALSESLLESELFGHKRGAFTGATEDKKGLFEAANGGTLFLDEIGELSPSVQVKLLRALDDRAIMRVGESTTRKIDVRFIAATNRDLAGEVTKGAFRNDLFFRLEGAALTVPPLAERVPEIIPLARLFLEQECRKLDIEPIPDISVDAIRLLEEYAWPGNVRELRNAMQRVAVLCAEDLVLPEHLPPRISGHVPTIPPARGSSPDNRLPAAPKPPNVTQPIADLPLSAEQMQERERIITTLDECAGNQTRAAERLGMSRRTFVTRLEEYQIPRPRKK
ncbi:MAG TPA: sigma 54-interacting transcriptional regulator [Polyangium sp.]|nr:sigma 54-interacting transcriptional regulator [Polyangium sp.]